MAFAQALRAAGMQLFVGRAALQIQPCRQAHAAALAQAFDAAAQLPQEQRRARFLLGKTGRQRREQQQAPWRFAGIAGQRHAQLVFKNAGARRLVQRRARLEAARGFGEKRAERLARLPWRRIAFEGQAAHGPRQKGIGPIVGKDVLQGVHTHRVRRRHQHDQRAACGQQPLELLAPMAAGGQQPFGSAYAKHRRIGTFAGGVQHREQAGGIPYEHVRLIQRGGLVKGQNGGQAVGRKRQRKVER